MNEPGFYIDIFLQPGDFYFGDHETRIRTILGSCVSITMWHPIRRIGGMCHYMLPKNKHPSANLGLDGKYADEAMRLFLKEIKASGTAVHDYEVKIFGGGNQFPGQDMRVFSVSENNVKIGRQLLSQYGFKVKSEHLGGVGPRNIMFDLWSGDVWVKHVDKIRES